MIILIATVPCSKSTFAAGEYLFCNADSFRFENGNLGHFDMVIHCPYTEIDSASIPGNILHVATKYLLSRVGNQFYNTLHFYSAQVIYFKKFKEIEKRQPWIRRSADKRVKYAVQYFFYVQDSMRYFLSLVFDKNAHIISNDQLPDIKNDKQAGKIISACKALHIAASDTLFAGESETIFLSYSNSIHAFVWQIKRIDWHSTQSHGLITRVESIHANTGVIIKREETVSIVDF